MVAVRAFARRLRPAPLLVALAMVAFVVGGTAPGRAAASGPPQRVVVQSTTSAAAARAVAQVGGTVDGSLPVIAGVAASVSEPGIAALGAMPSVDVTLDAVMHPTALSFDASAVDTQVAALDPGATWSADSGRGVGVALVDTGVADSPDLHAPRLVRSPDFSGEGDGIDHYGHGTFMAGLIAGDGTASAGAQPAHVGVAPGATVVSVKVGRADGSSSVSRVIAGIGWVIANRDVYNIGVLNLSFGLDSRLPYVADPLDAAAEAAWASGITVVVAAGNGGASAVTSPGDDPYVISVGATDTLGTVPTSDDTAPAWSSREQFRGYAKPDVSAPGVSLISLRAPGSTVDVQHPEGRVDANYFRGTGTSMSAAVVSGAVAVLLEHHANATPDDVKGAVVDSAVATAGDAKAVDLDAADHAVARGEWWQHFPLAFNGLGRGLRSGMPWTATRWRDDTWSATRWRASDWTATRWRAESWTATRWRAEDWSSSEWTATRWRALTWTDESWASESWG